MASRVKIHGASLTGCFIASASRSLGWDVVLCEASEEEQKRVQKDIFPNRFGKWDPAIQLVVPEKAPRGGFDFIVITAAPDRRLEQAMEALEEKPLGIMLDKPACPPSMELAHELSVAAKERGVQVFCAYDQVVSRAAEMLQEIVGGRQIGDMLSLDIEYREHWEAFFKAHPWIPGPQQHPIGSWEAGGGAGGEQSQGFALWQYFAGVLGQGRVSEIEAMVTYGREGKAVWDSSLCATLRTDKGFTGRVMLDVVTRPPRKRVRVQGADGIAEMVAGHSADNDAVFHQRVGGPEKISPVHKRRTDDFIGLLRHMWSVTKDRKDSPISLERALDTALLIAAAHQSENDKCRLRIDWSVGYTPEAIIRCG